ncbi:microtubule binding protein HOOK3, putative [Talaromyces stipitatus ATCC 10500]|uniref:Microtubule binding protein HOOK3, putative n=1 Tax=Talaromyces stipitatus (strain ATCC 10500 / CBS 375.48 / QM 6759 / NRRL 1006) TaxID=441959 RepID=B8MLD1_TALSN|nr:microtubule binding protein HOOK3, putative [Talaromyces stipitatus ATCC 10500]EED15046.1 microtubule binding protein HOOK3, putative [Talaromyces stipitatus ATCC 10500]
MTSEHTVAKVLLEWINSFSLGKTIRDTEELSDGIILWEILQDIDPQYFLDELPERNPSDHWVTKWQNLKHLHKLLTGYIRKQFDDEIPSGLDPSPDLKAISESNSLKETNKLLKLLLIAAISSPNAETYVTTLQKLSTPTQEGLKNIIEEAHNSQHEDLSADEEDGDGAPKRDLAVDPELQFEERVGKVLAENDRLATEKKEMEKALEDLHNRLARLQENNDTLQTRLASTEDRLVTLKSGKGDVGFSAKALESRSRQQEELIANQEAKLSAAQDEIDSLKMSLESMRVKTQRFQKLQDDYDEMKTERDQLIRKANAAEKYRQKLQASQDFEKENQTLKNQVKDLQQQLKEADSNQKRSSERDVELEEYRRVLPRIEQDRHEIQSLKKQLEFNNHALTERLQGAEEQRDRDEALISELRERIRELEGSTDSPSYTPGNASPRLQSTLQKDLDDIGARETQLKSENEELRKEVNKLKMTNTLGSSLEGYSENLILTAQLAQAKSSQSDEYWKLYDQYAEIRQKLADAEDLIDATKRQLDDARAELQLVDKEKLDMITEVKDSNSGEITKIREEWDQLTRKIHHLEAEIDVSQALVRDMCVERNELRACLEEKQAAMRAEDEDFIKEIETLLAEFAARAKTENPDAPEKSGIELLKHFADVTEKSAETLAKRAEHIDQQNDLIKSLQEQIRHIEEARGDQDDDSIPKQRELELQEIINRQSREMALICSAWYDLQGRLQHSNITVARYRHTATGAGGGSADMQKGWLAKQRNLVSVASFGR